MSKQSKQAKKLIIAKQFTKIHLDGGKGPAKTTPKHGKDPWKRWCTKSNRQLWYRRNEPGARKNGNPFAGM